MYSKLNPQEEEKLKFILRHLREYRTPDSTRNLFRSKIDSMPEPEKVFEILPLKERIYAGSLEIYRRFQDVFARPVPVLVRVVALLMLFASIYSYAFLPQAPIVHNVAGMVKVFDVSRNEWVLARDNQKLQKGDIIKTFEDGNVDISLKGIYSMRLKRDSEIKVSQLHSKVSRRPIQFEVAKGKVLTYYNKYEGKRDFELRTNEVIASVVGTDFMLTALPVTHKTRIGVLDGVVRVTSTELPEGMTSEVATVYVKSRYMTEVIEGKLPPVPERMMEDEWLQLEELYSIGKKPQVALLISTGSTRTRELLSIAPLYISDKEPSILPERLTKIARAFNQAIKEGKKEKHIDIIGQFEELLTKYPNPKYDVQFLLFIGAYYERLGNHKRAIETFQKVVTEYPSFQLASIAQCATGLIYEEKLNNKEKAEEAYRYIISHYPESPEAEEAIAGLRRLFGDKDKEIDYVR